MERSLLDFCARVGEAANQGDFNFALRRIIDLVQRIILHQSSVSRVLSSPQLDRLCGLVGELARAKNGPGRIESSTSRPLVVRDCGHRLERPFLTRGHLTTCTSGGFEVIEKCCANYHIWYPRAW
jgi:hypothetical protein